MDGAWGPSVGAELLGAKRQVWQSRAAAAGVRKASHAARPGSAGEPVPSAGCCGLRSAGRDALEQSPELPARVSSCRLRAGEGPQCCGGHAEPDSEVRAAWLDATPNMQAETHRRATGCTGCTEAPHAVGVAALTGHVALLQQSADQAGRRCMQQALWLAATQSGGQVRSLTCRW